MGGGTSSNPMIPPEFAPLINSSVRNMVSQQGANPIGSYNGGNPMGVEGFTPGQQYGMGMTFGAGQQSPLNSIALQAAQRAAGMAGSGPLTGSYDPSGEMGLQDWAQLNNPYLGTGGEMGSQAPPIGAPGMLNVDPQSVQGTSYQGGPPNMSLPPPGFQGQQGANGGQSGGGAPGQIHGLPGQGVGGNGQGFHPSSAPTGQAWSGSQAFDGSNTANNPYLDLMSRGIPALERQYGNSFDASQGMPNFNGLQYTGSQHEIGGNPAIAQFFQQNGASQEDLARFLIQGSEAQRAQSTNPANIQAHLAQGQDVWGNDISQMGSNAPGNAGGGFLDRLKANHQAGSAPQPGAMTQARMKPAVAPGSQPGPRIVGGRTGQ